MLAYRTLLTALGGGIFRWRVGLIGARPCGGSVRGEAASGRDVARSEETGERGKAVLDQSCGNPARAFGRRSGEQGGDGLRAEAEREDEQGAARTGGETCERGLGGGGQVAGVAQDDGTARMGVEEIGDSRFDIGVGEAGRVEGGDGASGGGVARLPVGGRVALADRSGDVGALVRGRQRDGRVGVSIVWRGERWYGRRVGGRSLLGRRGVCCAPCRGRGDERETREAEGQEGRPRGKSAGESEAESDARGGG